MANSVNNQIQLFQTLDNDGVCKCVSKAGLESIMVFMTRYTCMYIKNDK